MPSTIETTTPEAIELALIGVIRGLKPEHSEKRSEGWTPSEGNDHPDGSTSTARLFSVELSPLGAVEGGAMGGRNHEAGLAVEVIVTYGPFETGLGTIIASDLWDLHDALTNAINTVPGLTFVELDGTPSQDKDGPSWAYTFTAQYMRARRG